MVIDCSLYIVARRLKQTVKGGVITWYAE